jgi:hypothetical protein
MLKYSLDIHAGTIEFNEKPNSTILSMLKYQGFRWSPRSKVWYRRRRGSWDFLTTLDKEQDKANGVKRPDGDCWACGNKNGYFRSYGAATPVYCDKCQKERQTKEPKY